MTYTHSKEYKGVIHQDRQRLFVEENCLKCSEFCGKEHDFEECKPFYERCPKPVKHPALFDAGGFIKCDVEGVQG